MARVLRFWPHSLPLAALAGGRFAVRRSQSFCEERGEAEAPKPSLARVSYTSTLRGDVPGASQVIRTIAEKAAISNRKAELSGHMNYDAEQKLVWQVLEGRTEALAVVWAKIKEDPRHVIHDDTIKMEVVEARKYPLGWGLRLSKLDPASSVDKADIPSGSLIQLRYKSYMRETGGTERAIVEDEILPQAVVRNASLGVTGWLLYNDMKLTIYQVLEGPPDVVEELYEKIRQDDRHIVAESSVQRRIVEQREFPNWCMAMESVRLAPWIAQSW